ncbi:MAG TPA: AMP-binding protein [Candidatus Saccharimonadales bacterium]|nr:AMP-binding protein [Candidatus Saccharimonadales bacterium]
MSFGTATPLNPAYFLDRASKIFSERAAIVDGDRRFTYGEFGERSHRLAGLLQKAGARQGDRIAALCTNSHVMLEMHNGVPMAGCALVPINIRLSSQEIAYILENSGARILIATHEFTEMAHAISSSMGVRLIVAGDESSEYEDLLKSSEPCRTSEMDEMSLLAINYTSGSTGRPKGVMYTHRGAYLQALAMAFHSRLGQDSAYLWTLPMFHCNGWCFTWAVTAAGATHICERQIDPAAIWSSICSGSVTHLCAAPTVLTMIAEAASSSHGKKPGRALHAFTGGAPPTPALLARLSALNLQVTHLYGLTETYGPSVLNDWQPEWSSLSENEKARLNARQGVGNVVTKDIAVIDAEGREVPADGETMGEIAIRGNNVTIGYYKDEEATRAAESNGYFRTGDLGVRFHDGYIELRDRAKDIIITGGENVASVEVEKALAEHPAVLEAVVVGRVDERWGEIPVAFVVLHQGAEATQEELIEFVCGRIARFKAPREIRFEELPKTSTGKIQKYLLRQRLSRQTEKEEIRKVK